MYGYILNQWIMARVTEQWVMDRVPKFISSEQCAVILATPQTPGTLLMAV
jgi:hypothetical protein